jgi:hypothetical protein
MDIREPGRVLTIRLKLSWSWGKIPKSEKGKN